MRHVDFREGETSKRTILQPELLLYKLYTAHFPDIHIPGIKFPSFTAENPHYMYTTLRSNASQI
jgi:hypothetical protein